MKKKVVTEEKSHRNSYKTRLKSPDTSINQIRFQKIYLVGWPPHYNVKKREEA